MIGMSLLASFLVAIPILFPSSSSPLAYDPDRTIQVATPAVTFPVTPSPADCTVEPRDAESLRALLGTPPSQEPASGTPVSAATVTTVPVGRPASGDIEASITATVYELHACYNAGDLRRASALITDDVLRNLSKDQSLTAQDIAFFTAEPTPVPVEARTAILAVTDVSVLSSGQVGAFVITNDALTGSDTVYMVLVHQGEQWLIDEIIEFVEA